MLHQIGGARVRDRVVPFRFLGQGVGSVEVGAEQRRFALIAEHVAFQEVRDGPRSAPRSDADGVRFRGPDVHQFEVATQPLEGMEAFALLPSDLDGAGQTLTVLELEGQEGVGNLRLVGFEVFEDEPNFADLIDANGPFHPALVVVAGGAPAEVADVHQVGGVAFDVDAGQLGVVVDPISLVHGLLKFEPAHGDHQPQHEEDRDRGHRAEKHEQEVLHTGRFGFRGLGDAPIFRSCEVFLDVEVGKVHAHLRETGEHASAAFGHLLDWGFSHRADAEHLAFQLVLGPDHLRAVDVL